ncbi:hypothetical protein BD408DRAFT_418798 [Parasitella parasitica]|nr:hypothetical protein BD408DRAFT_418798 [Parasitella parasitica]
MATDTMAVPEIDKSSASFSHYVLQIPTIYFIGILFACILLIATIMVCKATRKRHFYYGYGCDDLEEENERLLGTYLKKTPTYYQWNRTPPPCCSTPFPANSENKSSWEQRRSDLLKKYAPPSRQQSQEDNV